MSQEVREYVELPEGEHLEPLPMEPLVVVHAWPGNQLRVVASYVDGGRTRELEEVLEPGRGQEAVTLTAIHDATGELMVALRLAHHARLHPEHVVRYANGTEARQVGEA